MNADTSEGRNDRRNAANIAIKALSSALDVLGGVEDEYGRLHFARELIARAACEIGDFGSFDREPTGVGE